MFVGCLCYSPSNDRHSLCLILLRRVVAVIWFVTVGLVVQAGSVWTMFEYAERFGASFVAGVLGSFAGGLFCEIYGFLFYVCVLLRRD
ncbi:hypothetical protein MtrunA17_Chr2g0321281 [Medicago truncatula]|uniref:Transmembrane protein n=1 Tax=Medicago truncatula TaxID=3880 RepID=A0A396JAY2_MEDTR|nr:hypothetical protein MtrunA17_Chr2g0321281 [Medicago truncatula]